MGGAWAFLAGTQGVWHGHNPAAGDVLVVGISTIEIVPPDVLAENANTWFKVKVVVGNPTDFDTIENLVLTYDRYKYVTPKSERLIGSLLGRT